MNSLDMLNNYFKYYSIGNPKVLRQQFIDSCAEGICLDALNGLFDSLTGDFELETNSCDLLVGLYDGYPNQGFNQGHRDYSTNIGVFALNLGIIGVTLQSGQAIMA